MIKRMARVMGWIGALMWAGAGMAWAEAPVLMGYFEIKPHTYLDKAAEQAEDGAAGASARYFEAVAARMGQTVSWQGPLPFGRLTDYLKRGRLDGALVLTKNAERETYLFYPDAPYHAVQSIFVVRKDNPLSAINGPADVKGYRVGFLKGANLTPFITQNADSLTLDLVAGSDWVGINLKKLIAGRLDAVYDLNSSTMPFAATRMGIADQIRTLPLPEPPAGIYVVFSRASERGEALLRQYNGLERGPDEYAPFLQMEFDAARRGGPALIPPMPAAPGPVRIRTEPTDSTDS